MFLQTEIKAVYTGKEEMKQLADQLPDQWTDIPCVCYRALAYVNIGR